MPIAKQKVPLLSALAVLLSLALAVGCRGFFVNPTLTTITVNPQTPSVQQGSTVQMTATGTYDDGSVHTLSKNLFWTSANTAVATISTSGLVTAVSTGTTTITANSANISGTTTLTVTVGGLSSITISPSSTSIPANGTVQLTATGNLQSGGTVNLTSSATWTSSNTQVATVSGGLVSGLQPATPTTVTITASSGNVQGTAQVTVQ
jgi:trimeric autotransporter adhesin